MKKLPNGFTIMELMISVAIIGILSGLLLNVINPRAFQGRGRDAQRVSDLKSIQAALELYFVDNRVYPAAGNWLAITGSDALSTALRTRYMSSVPTDPLGTPVGTSPCGAGTPKQYYYKSNGGAYLLTAYLESANANTGHRCSGTDLSMWGTIASCAANLTFCYGVQNP